MSTAAQSILKREEWEQLARVHAERVRPWLVERESRPGGSHPVFDFLFDYYFYRPALLRRWSPGVDVLLRDALPGDIGWKSFRERDGGLILDTETFPPHRKPYLNWAVNFLSATGGREPQFGCFGLHEWAMLYQTPAARHGSVPLRVTQVEIAAVVESLPVRCSHFDAFRFFTPAAAPLNRIPLSRESTAANDQPGCVHVTMDLYKFAFTISPYSPGELVLDAFALAREAREIDMRASPYDLTQFGFEPIRVETKGGREEYVECQKWLNEKARPIRHRLLELYRHLRGD